MSNQKVHSDLLKAIETATSRRGFLKGAAATGLAVAGAGALPALSAAADSGSDLIDTPQEIFNVAITAERLAITFYENGVANADALGLTGVNLDYIKAALIEEQIHEFFFAANGGMPLTSTFSFPAGMKTFTNLRTFIETQQLLEGVFDSAFIAAVYEFSVGGYHDLARTAAQIAMVEEGHREVGLTIINFDPADNIAFAPQLVSDVNDGPATLAKFGFLSPVPGNTYTYQQADFNSPELRSVYNRILFKAPFVQPENDGGI